MEAIHQTERKPYYPAYQSHLNPIFRLKEA